MSTTTSSGSTEHPQPPHPGQPDIARDFVRVTINGAPKNIHRGSYIVSDLKGQLEVDVALELDQVVAGEFKLLPDTEHITIKGEEAFISHVRGGGSS